MTRDPLIAELLAEQRRQGERLENMEKLLEAVLKEPPPGRRLLTAGQLCEALQISRGLLHTMRGEGLPVVNLGSESPRYELEEVVTWLKARPKRNKLSP